ncbi:hypothetical protein SM080_000719 [Cronobacter sakazakii]|uniref:hypothetical protein n=1 Tax=Cronobacter dublinensis TaxID=413497 RepID=UPI000CFDBE65|nr:hypothetical protein [Cronobacter dublinensis]EGT4508917.1 hypothetical protein [Cronobacter sakazakii]ELY4758252.1 hypothetical protein [Cronobacter sakazakii]MDK1098224.1 hypothetical protein [Cronobacter sakazakii]
MDSGEIKNNDIRDLSRSVTISMLQDHLAECGFEDDKIVCASCGHHEFVLPVGDERDGEKYPCIVTMPIPFRAGKGIWSFISICGKCSNTLFYNVMTITAKLKEKGVL